MKYEHWSNSKREMKRVAAMLLEAGKPLNLKLAKVRRSTL